jgi:hypothetical protein
VSEVSATLRYLQRPMGKDRIACRDCGTIKVTRLSIQTVISRIRACCQPRPLATARRREPGPPDAIPIPESLHRVALSPIIQVNNDANILLRVVVVNFASKTNFVAVVQSYGVHFEYRTEEKKPAI